MKYAWVFAWAWSCGGQLDIGSHDEGDAGPSDARDAAASDVEAGVVMQPPDAPACGNGVLELSEECDDGAESFYCNADCTRARCQDRKLNRSHGEECDDGMETATCNKTCKLSRCGDGTLNETAGEECDTEGERYNCDLDCTLPFCGDGHHNPKTDEACDDGNTNDFDGCKNDCTLRQL